MPFEGDAFPIAGERRIFDKGPHMAVRLHKRGRDELDYGIDLRRFLRPGEVISAATAWFEPVNTPVLSISSVDFTAGAVRVWIAGGADAQSYAISVLIQTSEGREKLFRFFLSVRGDSPTHMLEGIGEPIGVCAGMHPQLVVDPPEISFPDTLVGETSEPIAVTVSNIGALRATVDAIEASAGFTVTANTVGTLEQGEYFTLWVRFAPSAAGTIGGYVTIDGNAPVALIMLAQAI